MDETLELLILRANIECRQDDIVGMDTPPLHIDENTSVPAIFALGCAHASAEHGDRARAVDLLERALTTSNQSIRVGAVSAIEMAGRIDLAKSYTQRFLEEATEVWEQNWWKHILETSGG